MAYCIKTARLAHLFPMRCKKRKKHTAPCTYWSKDRNPIWNAWYPHTAALRKRSMWQKRGFESGEGMAEKKTECDEQIQIKREEEQEEVMQKKKEKQ